MLCLSLIIWKNIWLSLFVLPGLDDVDEEPDMNIKRDELVNPYWMESPDLGKGKIKLLDQAETYFFKVILNVSVLVNVTSADLIHGNMRNN